MIRRLILIFEFILISFVATAQLPVMYNVTGGGAFCQGGLGVSISLSGSEGSVTYELWNGGTATGITIIGTGSALNFTGVNTAGDYTVVGTNGNGTTTMSGNAIITVNGLPAATITGVLISCATTTLTAVTDAVTPAYVWYKDNVLVSGQTASTLVVSASGAYKVKVTNENGCEQTSLPSAVTINPLPTTSAIYHQ
jgi:uncharacterized Zn-binding protein involved in type VI secretion